MSVWCVTGPGFQTHLTPDLGSSWNQVGVSPELGRLDSSTESWCCTGDARSIGDAQTFFPGLPSVDHNGSAHLWPLWK